MNSIYIDCIKNFINLNDLLNTFKNNFKDIYGDYPNIEQQKSWETSINFLKIALNHNELHDLIVAFEYRLPFSNERIDLMIFGKAKDEKPMIILFELKGWKKAESCYYNYIVDSDIGKTIHPEYQVKNYVGKIKFSHSESENFNIIPSIVMYNANREDIEIEFSNDITVFYNNTEELTHFIRSNLPSTVDIETVERFINGEYKQSKKLFGAIRQHYVQIQQQSYLTLAEDGWGLSSEQIALVEEILRDFKEKDEKIVYLVQGAPGSGKTLVAIHLLLSSLNKKHQTILAYRNNRLINSIRNIFDSIERGLSNPIKFYSMGPRANFKGVAEKNFNGPVLDLVIFDEAQRMTKENIKYAMQRGKITVFFYDEGQILNIEEEGNTQNFVNEANNQGKKIKERFLRGFYRTQGGEQYQKFVENLLENPNNISEDGINTWQHNYDFRVCSTIDELFSLLEERRDRQYKVALIAAFTESPGDLKNTRSIKNLRIGYPLYSNLDIYNRLQKKVFWLMDPINDYVPFWVHGESNNLEKCASIYGCQGFETDYAGIIWGRDFIYRDNKWQLGNNCEDNIGNPSLKVLINKAKNGDQEAERYAYQLLINRYRIFLTRGIKGSYIFCEDQETADFFIKIYDEFVA